MHSSITYSAGRYQYAAGNLSDKILGDGAITYKLKLASVSGQLTLTSKHVVLYTSRGSLTGTGSALVTVSGTTETITAGRLSLTNGAGSLRHHALVAKFTGSGDLTANSFTFNYKGRYR